MFNSSEILAHVSRNILLKNSPNTKYNKVLTIILSLCLFYSKLSLTQYFQCGIDFDIYIVFEHMETDLHAGRLKLAKIFAYCMKIKVCN